MFDSVIGQDFALDQMAKALSHPVNTYVFYGSRGTFVEESAKLFASRLLDQSGEIDERILRGVYPDVIEFEPIGNSYRVKEDVRQNILGEFRKPPIENNGKVLIVHDAHLLRSDSANTLLKSLEETPTNLFWILIAPTKDLLIQTIRSRAYAIEFARLDNAIIESVLIEEGINPEKARDVAIRSAGRLDRARLMCASIEPIKNCVDDLLSNISDSGSFVSGFAQKISDTFEEIASDVVASNKSELVELEKTLKQSGYSDKIAKSIKANHKAKIESQEKRLRKDLLKEFLDALNFSVLSRADNESNNLTSQNLDSIVKVSESINEFSKRLVYNPTEVLFLESLLATLSDSKNKVN